MESQLYDNDIVGATSFSEQEKIMLKPQFVVVLKNRYYM